MAAYDKHYVKKEYFGKPYAELIAFFEQYSKRGTLVDLGAGQGRDAAPLAKMGYDVTAVDVSQVGLKLIKASSPYIKTVQADVYTFDVSEFDIILMDSMLHFYSRDKAKESKLVSDILDKMKTGAVLVNFLMKSAKSEKVLMNIIECALYEFDILENRYIDYPEGNCQYHFLAVKKR
ncbi:MAG: methyltransferase domain-containing protein [Clostridia bacterium]|nr:methyltransferase domain-containing protein [Clostridia bacterium]MBT7121838.1 methyltransferase domain-containing protein [Clostridia bacterium]